MQTIVDAGLGRVETRLWPLASLKGVEGGFRKERAERRQRKKARDQERRDARRRKRHR
jgi:hypothetical protein